jgi:hypothetical protein
LEFANVTDNDATTIGTRLALGQGVSDAIAILQPELTSLDRTITANAEMLQTITLLGQGLNAFKANAAPIAVPSYILDSPEVHMGQPGLDLPEPARAPRVYQPTSHNVPGAPARSHQGAPPDPPKMPISDGRLPTTRPLSRQDVAMTSHAVPPPTMAAAIHASRALIAPAMPTSVEPASIRSSSIIAPSIARSAPEVVASRPLHVGAPRAAVATMAATDEIAGPPLNNSVEQIVIGAMAPGGALQIAADIPSSQAVTDMFAPPTAAPRGGIRPARAVPPYTTADAAVQPEESQPALVLSELPQTESEPRQGMLVLDGAQLGRWVIDHLEKHASRPGAMTTGIDPRMNAAYPGAPTGA